MHLKILDDYCFSSDLFRQPVFLLDHLRARGMAASTALLLEVFSLSSRSGHTWVESGFSVTYAAVVWKQVRGTKGGGGGVGWVLWKLKWLKVYFYAFLAKILNWFRTAPRSWPHVYFELVSLSTTFRETWCGWMRRSKGRSKWLKQSECRRP